jgi:hypothetical protein
MSTKDPSDAPPDRGIELLSQEGFKSVGVMALVAKGIRLQGDGSGYLAGLPATTGVYAFILDRQEVAYIGSATNLGKRVWSYGFDFDRRYANPNRRVNDEM